MCKKNGKLKQPEGAYVPLSTAIRRARQFWHKQWPSMNARQKNDLAHGLKAWLSQMGTHSVNTESKPFV